MSEELKPIIGKSTFARVKLHPCFLQANEYCLQATEVFIEPETKDKYVI